RTSRRSGRAGRNSAMGTSGPFRLTRGQRLAAYAVLLLLSVPALLPMTWMVSTSFKADSQIFQTEGKTAPTITLSSLIPRPLRWQNYPAALQAVPFTVYLRNTVWLCAITVIGAVLSSAIVAYGFARLEFRGKSALFLLMISTMALPGQVTMIPIFALFRWL